MTGGDGLFLGLDVGTSATRVSLVRPDASGGIASAVTASAGYLRALREPLPGLRAVVSGGIAAGEVGDYLAAGAHAVCLGGALIDRAAARRGDVGGVAARARAALDRMSAA